MPSSADLFAPLDDGTGLLRMVSTVETFARKKGDAEEQWIHIMPFGPVVTARDGRTFQISDLLKVAAHTELPLLIDWEHDSEFGRTRAAGWVEELEIQNTGEGDFPRPGLWGRAAWTDDGSRDVSTKSYRFLSPTLLLDKETRDAVKVLAVALTNRPALSMQGLDTYRETMSARLGHHPNPQGETAMTPETKRALCSQLGLNADASDASIMEAIGRASTSTEMCTRLTSDLTAATTRAQLAEQKLAELTRVSFEQTVDATLDKASTDGKVTPAQRTSWREFCLKGQDNFDQFTKQVLPALPAIGDVAPPSPGPTDEKPNGKPVRSLFGYSAEKLAKARQYIADQRAAVHDDDEEG
jgi:phage I-like protein